MDSKATPVLLGCMKCGLGLRPPHGWPHVCMLRSGGGFTSRRGEIETMTPAPKVCLQVRNLTKRFGEFVALRDISIDIHEGEFVCFLGPSGCGKTTLLRCIAGLEYQNEGEILQNDRDISWLPP